MPFLYECKECGEQTTLDYNVSDTCLCDCGGQMRFLGEDHFSEVEYIEPCMICRNRNSDKCSECGRAERLAQWSRH